MHSRRQMLSAELLLSTPEWRVMSVVPQALLQPQKLRESTPPPRPEPSSKVRNSARNCDHADQCFRRECVFKHPSGGLCPSYPDQCSNFGSCRSRHPPPPLGPIPVAASSSAVHTAESCPNSAACTEVDCSKYHPVGALCRSYLDCPLKDKSGCHFRHPEVSVNTEGKLVSRIDNARMPKTPQHRAKQKMPAKKGKKAPRSASPGQSKTTHGSTKRALLRHDAIIKDELEKFRAAVVESSQRSLSGVDSQNELTRKALQAKLEELAAQRTVFVELTRRIDSDKGGDEAKIKARRNLLKREKYRFAAHLPALAKRLEIERHLSSTTSQFTVIQGQTGSGKSTQIPQYAADMACFAGKRIICTQPRKLAAKALTARVAYEYSCGWETAQVGDVVGFRVGGQFKTSKRTRIEYVTEAVLLDVIARARRGTGENPFTDVGCIIVDEAHERSIICDLIVGSLKENHAKWNHVKVAITSATIDLDLFSGFFNNAPVVEIPGRMFPVKVEYVVSNGQSSGVIEVSKDTLRRWGQKVCIDHQPGLV